MQPSSPTLAQRVAELHPNRRVAWAGFFAACAALALLHLFGNGRGISHKELWIDEASTWLIAQYPLKRIAELAIESHSQPPLYYVLLHGLSRLSSSEVVIRGMSWSFCLLLIAFVLLGLNELKIASRLGLCLLFVTNEHTLFLSQELRPYALSALSTFVASVLFLRFLRRPRDRRLAFLYLGAALVMVYTLAFDVWTLVAHGIAGAAAIVVALRRQGLRRAARETWPVVATLGALGALYLPYLLYVLAYEPPTGRRPAPAAVLAEAFKLAHHAAALDRFTDFLPPFALALQLLALLGVLRGLLRRDRSALFWPLLFFGQIAFCYGFMLGKIPVAFRYLTPAFLALLTSMALGLDALLVAPVARVASPLLLAAAMALAAYFVVPFQASLRAPEPRTNWRRLYDELAKIPGEKVLFFDNGPYAQMLEYVARDDRSLTFYTNRYEDIPGTAMSASGEFMTREYVEEKIAARAAEARCFFYSKDKRGARRERNRPVHVYEDTFLPAMARLGYEEAFKLESGKIPDPFHDYFLVTGFCRP